MRSAFSAVLPLLASIGAASPTFAGANATSIPLQGLLIRNGVNQTRSSAPDTIAPAYIYRTTIDGTAHGGAGVLALLFPNPTPIGAILEQLIGMPVDLNGTAYNPSGTLPAVVPPFTQSGSTVVSGITVDYAVTLSTTIDAAGIASFSITDVVLSPAFLVGFIQFDSGQVSITRVCPGDTNADNLINFADLNQVLSEFGSVGVPGEFAGDVNGDGSVSFADLNIVLSAFGGGC